MRKLISIATLLIYTVNAQNFQQYQFQPQYQSQSGEYASEGSLYLPPETQTTLPYFPLKGSNNLPYQYLPPTGTKAPSVYPSPFPVMMSSIVPNFDEDDEEDDDANDNRIRLSSPQPQNMFKLRPNFTQSNAMYNHSDKKEMRSLPKTVSYNHPIDRIDIKFPLKMGPTQPPQIINMQNPSNRRMIMENVKSEALMGDQVKTASYNGVQYIQPPPGYLGSTTEPAIPILRLSNEMDLDGSYSYEALGADQTHYVQHSRMENMGTDKEEQVVEGSYSYVGDNGQTYTVHYVADANGFRASGDHLPVGPPIPEIIQRSIQYNLAEEAKKPPHLQGWHDEERLNEIDGRDRIQRFPASPPRGLFTGRTPEAFSYNFAKTQNNNIVPAPSSPAPVIAHLDQPKDQPPKQGNAPISPQITFLASQGAHVPMNPIPIPQPQTIARVFNANNEKSPMPKLMNYEFTTIENENENNKPLWRWQYGLNANAAKHLISRSSGYNEDEVSMNFNEMTPEQYKFMINSQFSDSGSRDNKNTYDSPVSTAPIISSTEVESLPINHNNVPIENEPVEYKISTVRSIIERQNVVEQKHVPITPYISNWQERSNDEKIQLLGNHQNVPSREHNIYQNKAPKLITQNDFIPPSQMVTQSYDYDENYYEPRKIKLPRNNNLQNKIESENHLERPVPRNEPKNLSVFTEPNNVILAENISAKPTVTIEYTTPISIKAKEWIPLRPVIESDEYFSEQNESPTSTTEKYLEEILKTNIFLKNAFQPKQEKNNREKEFNENESSDFNINTHSDKLKTEEKNPKSLQSYQYPLDDAKLIRKRPLDINDVLNYVATKNHFESSKIRPKYQKTLNFATKPDIPLNFPHSKLGEGNYYYNNNDNRNDVKEYQLQEKPNTVVKKYKTLQRNNNYIADQSNKEIRRDLTPPPQDYKNKPNIPPLGRAGPTLKSYLPPIFV